MDQTHEVELSEKTKLESQCIDKDDESQHLLSSYSSNSKSANVIIDRIRRTWPLLLQGLLFNPKLLLHCFASALLLAYLASNVSYLSFKVHLYWKELPSVLACPWLLLILLLEFLYLFSGLVSAVDYFVPPTVSCCNSALDDKSLQYSSVLSKCSPTVDVFIPCCKESTDIPQESILAALALDYPKDRYRVIILDDGEDDDLKAFCQALQSESGSERLLYLRRKKIPGVPHNFKCGNMNFGLEHSNAEYVVMMDADMILHPTFLRRLLPHIINSPDVAFVQVPQSFYNLPVGDPLNDACGFGYDRVMVHRNTLGCASCVGTGVIFRRSCLDEIGGFQPQSITEDTMTAYVLFNRGYKSVYVNEKLQVGLVPWTFEGFVKQRQRWGQGAIQQLLATWKDMLGWNSKLNFLQKACYFWHTGYYYMSVINVTLLICLWSALAFQMNLDIGTKEENQELLSRLAIFMSIWRVFWYALWLEVPQAVQSRNRDESQFWWMTPFFFKMVMEAAFNYRSTFKFIPTSNIDKKAADDKATQSSILNKLDDLKHVRVHIFIIVVGLSTVSIRLYYAISRYGLEDCHHTFHALGLSVFIVGVCVHMLVPVIHILWPTGYQPEQRKLLLRYNVDGVPQFNPSDCGPKWHPIIILYEFISYSILAFWVGVYWAMQSGSYQQWCSRPT